MNVDVPASEIRKRFIDISLRRARAGTGSSPRTLDRRTAAMETLDLRSVLTNVAWAVVGGVATRAYMAERATLDLDILVHQRDARVVRAKLEQAGFEYQEPFLVGGTTWKSPDGRMLDVLESDEAWVDEALRSPTQDPQGLPVLSLPYLVLMKLISSRTQDLADISRMMGGASESEIADVLLVVTRHLPGAVDDLKSLIHLGKLERGQK